MSDFREYSAAFMDHQSDLAHHGVKGMKWHHHKRLPIVGIDTKKVGQNIVTAVSGGEAKYDHKDAIKNFTLKDFRYMSKPLSNLSDKALDDRESRLSGNDKYTRSSGPYGYVDDKGEKHSSVYSEIDLEENRIRAERQRREQRKRIEARKNNSKKK